MSEVSVQTVLHSVPFFSHLSPEQLQSMAEAGQVLSVEGGSVIFREGEPAEQLYLILTGSVRVEARAWDGSDVELSTLGSGDFFGELALAGGNQRSATVTAVQPCELFCLSRQNFLQQLSASPELLSDVIAGISRKMRHANARQLEKIQEKHRLALQLEQHYHETLVRLVAGLSEEIQKPMRLMNAMSQILQQDLLQEILDTPVQQGQTLRKMLDATRLLQSQMARLETLLGVFQLLELDASQQMPACGNLGALLEEMLSLFRLESPGGLSYALEVAPTAAHKPWQGNPRLLQEILQRLLENCASHAYAGRAGQVQLRLKGTLLENQAAFELVVEDRGRGMSEQEVQKACQPFFSTARDRGHLGLGLTVADTLTHLALQGVLRIESALEEGTRVRLIFPRILRPRRHCSLSS